MYWRSGYDWQHKPWEEEWCIQCEDRRGDKCESEDDIEITTCDDENTWFVLRNRDGNSAQLQIAEKDLCLGMYGEKKYFGNVRPKIETRECDPSDGRQFFSAGWNFERFEIITPNGGCLSQDHHPKSGEELFAESCSRADGHDTNYWIMY